MPQVDKMPGGPPATGAPPADDAEVWHSRYGPIVIQARGDEVWVDGQRVEPAHAAEAAEVNQADYR